MKIKNWWNNLRPSTKNSLIAVTAMGLLVVGLVAFLVNRVSESNLVNPTPVEAKETFYDMKGIVEDHSGEYNSAFTILDIVPSELYVSMGTGTDKTELTLTTMGYLVKGQDPMTDMIAIELSKTSSAEDELTKYTYLNYGDRTDLAEDFVPLETGSLDKKYTIAYKEGYGGCGKYSGNEWKKIFDNIKEICTENGSAIYLAIPGITDPGDLGVLLPLTAGENLETDYPAYMSWLEDNIQNGRFYGTAKIFNETTENSRTGYDYMRIGGTVPDEEPEFTDPQTSPQAQFLYVGAGKGNYKLTATDKDSDYLFEVYNAPTYITCYSGEDLLKRYVFASLNGYENYSEDFKIEIKKVKAGDVTKDDVANADLIYLEDGFGRMVPGTFRNDIKFLAKNPKDEEDIGVNNLKDMDENVALLILDTLVNEEKPVIVDHTVSVDDEHYFSDDFKDELQEIKDRPLTETYTKAKKEADIEQLYKDNYSIYQKLAKILEKKEYDMYYTELLENVSSDEKKIQKLFDIENINTKYAVDDKKGDDYDYSHVHEHVFVVDDISLLDGEYFFGAKYKDDLAKEGFSEILDAIDLENTSLKDDDKLEKWVSKARAIQFILCKTVAKFKDVRILEIQPTSNNHSDLVFTGYSTTRKLATLYWENYETKEGGSSKGVILNSSSNISVNVNTISVDCFNSDLEDINSEYSMIFIGLDGQKHNREKLDTGSKISLFNTESLKGLAYHNSKDGSYDAFDLLPIKADALYDYMKAGYPIVVEDACFTNKSAQSSGSEKLNINTKLIQEGSNMYNFLKTAVSDNEYHKCIFTVSDARKSSTFLKEITMSRPCIQYADELHTAVTKIDKVTGVDASASFDYRIWDGTTTTRLSEDGSTSETIYGEYDVPTELKLYFDYNGDGVFTDSEEAPDYSCNGGTLTVNFGTINKAFIHYALKVVSTENTYRRDSITGYFDILDAETTPMLILQVIADGAEGTAGDDSFKYNLFTAVTVDRNTAPGGNSATIGYAFDEAEEMVGVSYGLVTATVSDVAASLAENPDYIREFDTLVLGFGPEYSLDPILGEVNEYINEGRAVVIGSAAYTDSALGLGKDKLYQTSDRTYAAIGHEGSYYRFDNKYAEGGIFEPKTEVVLYSDNDGGIAHYPYEIGDRPRIAENDKAAVKPNQYLLDFSKNISGTSLTQDISSGDNVTSYYTYGEKYNTENGSPYEVSMMDGRNNYYVYSRSNIYYISASEYPYEYSKGSVPTEGLKDCEIFVNALMNAYNVSVKNPHIQIVADYGIDAPQIDSITVPFDTSTYGQPAEQGVIDNDVYLYFKFNDANIGYNKKYNVSFSYGDAYPSSILMYPKTYSGGDMIWRVINNKETPLKLGEGETLLPGVTYKVIIPSNVVSLMPTVYATVETEFDRAGIHHGNLKSHDSAKLNKALLFMLE